MNAIENQGLPMTLRAMRAYVDSPPVDAQFKIAGRTPLSAMEDLAEKREQALLDKMIERVNRLCETATARVEEADEALDLLEENLEAWVKGMKAGRLDPDEVIKSVSQCPAVLKELTQDYDSAKGDAEGAAEFMEQDPADFEADQLARFPRLADALPVVTEAWLKGDPDAPDPLAEPRDPSNDSQIEATNHLLGAGGA